MSERIKDRLANNMARLRIVERKLKGAMRCKQIDVERRYQQQKRLLEGFVESDTHLLQSLEQGHQRRMATIQSAVMSVSRPHSQASM